jgi:hypothetical protein
VWVTGIFCRCRFIASESSIISFVLVRPIYYFYKERDKHIWDSNTSSNVLDHTPSPPPLLAYILNKDTFMVACASKYRRPHVSSRRDFPPLNVTKIIFFLWKKKTFLLNFLIELSTYSSYTQRDKTSYFGVLFRNCWPENDLHSIRPSVFLFWISWAPSTIFYFFILSIFLWTHIHTYIVKTGNV